jgi:glycine/D-amino acid oxidase-like deaminating enzyme
LHGRHLGSDNPSHRNDVVVIGAGVVGLSAALELRKRGLSVCVLDRSGAGGGQSSRNWGFIRQQGRAIEELPLMVESNKIWSQLERDLGFEAEWRQGGNLRLTDSPERAEDYRQWVEVAGSYGLHSRVVERNEVEAIMPGFAGQYLLAIFTPSDGQVNPVKAMRGYLLAARSSGVEVYENLPALEIVTAGGRVEGVMTSEGFIGASKVIVAAGVGSAALLRGVGIHMPIQFVTQTVALTSAVPWLTDACVWTGEIGFRQTRSGGIVFAAGGRGDVKVDAEALSTMISPGQFKQALGMYWKNREYLRVRPKGVTRLLTSPRRISVHGDSVRYSDVGESFDILTNFFPQLRCEVAMAWGGTIDGTPDGLPILEALREPVGLAVATGLSGHGFGIGPAVGKTIAELVTSGSSSHDLLPFRLRRFREGKANAPRPLL